MPRKLRGIRAGGLVHVWARGVERRAMFRDDLDRNMYLALLGGVSRRQGWACLAYCLMDNHVHFLLDTPETPGDNLADGMRRLHGTYALGFNCRHVRAGSLFEKRYGNADMIPDERALASVASYIAVNPVAARMVATPEEWSWSSHGARASGRAPAWLAGARLDGLLGATQPGGAGSAYHAAVAMRLADLETPDLALAA